MIAVDKLVLVHAKLTRQPAIATPSDTYASQTDVIMTIDQIFRLYLIIEARSPLTVSMDYLALWAKSV